MFATFGFYWCYTDFVEKYDTTEYYKVAVYLRAANLCTILYKHAKVWHAGLRLIIIIYVISLV